MNKNVEQVLSIESIEPSKKQRTTVIGLVLFLFLIVFLTLPNIKTLIVEINPFLPIFISWLLIADILISFLMFIQYRVTCNRAILILAGTYLFTGLITVPHILTFPNVFTEAGLLSAGSQTAVWFWVLWHSGFPIGILFYVYTLRKNKLDYVHRQGKLTFIMVMTIICIIVMSTIVLTKGSDYLPVIIEQGNFRLLLDSGIGPVVLLLNIVALVCLMRQTKMKSTLHLWLVLSVLAFTLDVFVTLFSGARFSVGWYVARLLSLFSATVVLAMFFIELNRLYLGITESNQMLKKTKKETTDILESIRDAFIALDKFDRFIYMNREAVKLSQKKGEELIGQSIWEAFPHLKKLMLFKAIKEAKQNKTLFQYVGQDARTATWFNIRIYPREDGVSVFLSDITKRVEAEERLKEANLILQRLSHMDGLTEIANRRFFDDQLIMKWETAVKEGTPLSLMLFDIDYFKGYNDFYGHQAGDACLNMVAKQLEKTVQQINSTYKYARYGGEEFAVIMPNTGKEEAFFVAESIRKAIEVRQFEHARSEVSRWVTISAGVFTMQPHESNYLNDLIKETDRILYLAKSQGRNRVCQDDDMMQANKGIHQS